ncbi:Unannotated [Lentimonas sp. CC4]|nr:Unannotated [Lentimonas sp. CC4]
MSQSTTAPRVDAFAHAHYILCPDSGGKSSVSSYVVLVLWLSALALCCGSAGGAEAILPIYDTHPFDCIRWLQIH